MFHFLLGATSAYFQGQTLLLVSGNVTTFCHLTLFSITKKPWKSSHLLNHRNPNFGWFQVHQTYGFQWSLTYTPGNEQLLNLKMPHWPKTSPVVGPAGQLTRGCTGESMFFPFKNGPRNWIPSNSLVNRTWLWQTPPSATGQGVKGWSLGLGNGGTKWQGESDYDILWTQAMRWSWRNHSKLPFVSSLILPIKWRILCSQKRMSIDSNKLKKSSHTFRKVAVMFRKAMNFENLLRLEVFWPFMDCNDHCKGGFPSMMHSDQHESISWFWKCFFTKTVNTLFSFSNSSALETAHTKTEVGSNQGINMLHVSFSRCTLRNSQHVQV